MIDSSTRAVVAERAGDRCEYCLLLRTDYCWPFHIEHIISRQHDGDDSLDNLALACPRCNRYKGTNLTAIDPNTGRITQLYNPRLQSWPSHFRIVGDTIQGITDTGRATVRLLKMNAENRRELRHELE